MKARRAESYPVPPLAWQTISASPVMSSGDGRWHGPLMRWWIDVDPNISQPALDHHYVAMHLGGAKRVTRIDGGERLTADIESGALSIIPAGAAFQWSTRGPVEFAHIYLAPSALTLIGIEEFDRDPSALSLEDRLGIRDSLVQALFLELLEGAAGTTSSSRLYVDTLFHSLQMRMVQKYARVPTALLRVQHSLAPFRLRRVLDFIEENLADDVSLRDLAAVATTSPFHFSRAFASAVGTPPYSYLLTRRIERAKGLLRRGVDPVASVAAQCGFHTPAQFSRVFRRLTGISPRDYRGL